MATGNTRINICSPGGVNEVLCKAVRKVGIGAEISPYRIELRNVENWNISLLSPEISFEEEWDVTAYIVEDSVGPINSFEENWEITQYATEDSFGPIGNSIVEEWES